MGTAKKFVPPVRSLNLIGEKELTQVTNFVSGLGIGLW